MILEPVINMFQASTLQTIFFDSRKKEGLWMFSFGEEFAVWMVVEYEKKSWKSNIERISSRRK